MKQIKKKIIIEKLSIMNKIGEEQNYLNNYSNVNKDEEDEDDSSEEEENDKKKDRYDKE